MLNNPYENKYKEMLNEKTRIDEDRENFREIFSWESDDYPYVKPMKDEDIPEMQAGGPIEENGPWISKDDYAGNEYKVVLGINTRNDEPMIFVVDKETKKIKYSAVVDNIFFSGFNEASYVARNLSLGKHPDEISFLQKNELW